MNTTKLTMIVLSAAAVVLGGCSGDSRVTGPGNGDKPDIDKNLVETTAPAETENNAARVEAIAFDQKIERTSFEATVKKSEVEGGCWYLESEKSEHYTPYFEKDIPVLQVGLKLLVYGYVDENMNSFCMIGPVFRVEKYTHLWRNDSTPAADAETESAAATAATSAEGSDSSEEAASDARSQDNLIVLKGYYGSNDEGCMYISDGKDVIVELYFVQRICPDISNGALVAVKGEYSLLTWSPCQLAPLFNVTKFQVLEGGNWAAQDGLAEK